MLANVLFKRIAALVIAAPTFGGAVSLAQSAPEPSAPGGFSELNGVAAASQPDVWAVGYHDRATLVRHWDGSAWTRIPSPTVDGVASELNAVAVAGPDDVWAVGDSGPARHTLIEHWDGAAWSIVPGVDPGNATNKLTAVSAVSPDDVWAVGLYGDSGESTRSLALHWNGSRWSRSTLFKRPYGHLGGVVALSAADAWAVGQQASQRSVATHWNGSGWAKWSPPNRGGSLTNLTAVDAVSPTNVWAVGYYNTAQGNQPISVHWDGTEWRVVPMPTPGAAQLYSISAVTASDMWAVGGDESGPEQTLAEHWDGSTWSVVPTPSRKRASVLNAVSAVSDSFAVAVGYSTRRGTEARVVAEFWDGASWTKG